MSSRDAFAAAVARHRAVVGLSLAEVAARAHIARGHVHNVERGHRWPSRSVAASLDTALSAHGDLVAIWEAATSLTTPDADVFDRFAQAVIDPTRTDPAVVEHLQHHLAGYRRAEDVLGARRVLPAVLAQLDVIRPMIRHSRGSTRDAVLSVASQYDQFAAWMYQDLLDSARAQRHYSDAMDAAQQRGDPDMIASILSLTSHLAWSQRDAGRAIALAQAGQRQPNELSAAVGALLAQQEARAHALDGDPDATDRSLERAEAMTHLAVTQREEAPPWVYFHGPDRLGAQRGIAYLALGRHRDAAESIDATLRTLDSSYDRDRGRYSAILATALVGAGDADTALRHALHAADLAAATGSALTVNELRGTRDALRHAGADQAVTTLTDHIGQVGAPARP